MDVRFDTTGWVRATLDGRHGLLMHAFGAAPLEAEVRVGRRTPLEGWVSRNYGQVDPAPALVFTATTRLPIRVVTLLWPSERVHEETPRVEVIHDHQGLVAGLVFRELAKTIMFGDGEPVIQRGGVPNREEVITRS
jgi:hypothetical protein